MVNSTSPDSFGHVDADGTVYVRTAAGERMVGQVPDATPQEAIAFYIRRYEALAVEVGLLEDRLKSGTLPPDEARRSVNTLRASVETANAVGDLDSLTVRLDALLPAIDERVEARKAERVRAQEESREAKEKMVVEAEKLAESNDWRGGVNRFRALLDEWKALPRIDRATDDELWRRFSAARTVYTRRRKTQFAEQSAKRETSRQAKEAILAEAREHIGSTNWGETAAAFRDLMARWKAAGAAPREVDDAMWQEFRSIQDDFFTTRQATFDAQNVEYSDNLAKRQALLDEAEATILPITDLAASRVAFRNFVAAYNEVGRVPREQIRALDARFRALESALRTAEEDEWRRTDPEAKARAEETVAKLEAQIDKLRNKAETAEARGDKSAAEKITESINTYQTWLDQARETLADFNR